jgi:hypothetical protein
MIEQPEWPGVWLCVDFQEPINFKAPFAYKCSGMLFESTQAMRFVCELEKQKAVNN